MEKLKKLLMKAEELGWNYEFKKDEHLVDYVALETYIKNQGRYPRLNQRL